MKSLVTTNVGFEAARTLDGVHHGHSFKAQIQATQFALNKLSDRLKDVIAPLNYCNLDEHFSSADDLALAKYIGEKFRGQFDRISLRSAPLHGIELDAMGQAVYWIQDQFEAAHQLPHVPDGHQCGRLHGHGFGIRIEAKADQHTIVTIQAAWQKLRDELHHHYLNHIEGLSNPTSEVLAQWLYQRLDLAGLVAVEIYETASAGSRYDGKGWRIWKELHFEAACPLDENGNYTGHSYCVRLHLAHTELDPLYKWILDFADVKKAFKPLYQALDHHALDELPNIQATDCTGLARYLAEQFQHPHLARIDVLEQADHGAILWVNPICTA